MNTLKQKKYVEPFETLLMYHVEMCYAVALTLTHNPDDAHDLTREVLVWAWNLRDSTHAKQNIKGRLLMTMREIFIKDYRQPCTDV